MNHQTLLMQSEEGQRMEGTVNPLSFAVEKNKLIVMELVTLKALFCEFRSRILLRILQQSFSRVQI